MARPGSHRRIFVLTILAAAGVGAILSHRIPPPPPCPVLPEFDAPPEVWKHARERMVAEQFIARDITDPRVLEAMGAVPREEFVSREWRPLSYADQPLLLPHDQRISQPYVVARMLQELKLRPEDRVLEIGTGSGYEAAVLSRLVREVYTMEIFESLAYEAETVLHRLGCANVHVRAADGFAGWPEAGPFDAIIITCGVEIIPPPLLAQLRDGGRLIAPAGAPGQQRLQRTVRHGHDFEKTNLIPVQFSPLIHPAP